MVVISTTKHYLKINISQVVKILTCLIQSCQ